MALTDPPVPATLEALLRELPVWSTAEIDKMIPHGHERHEPMWVKVSTLQAALRAAGPQKTPEACRDLIDVDEAARISGLAKATFYKLARHQRLRSFKVLAALRFDRRDVLALVNERPATREDARKG